MNRVDAVCPFSKLSQSDCVQIAEKCLNELKSRAETVGTQIIFDESVASRIAESAQSDSYGAREIKREIVRQIEDPLADAMIKGSKQIFCFAGDKGIELSEYSDTAKNKEKETADISS